MDDENLNDHYINFKHGLDINRLVSGDGAVFEVNFDDLPNDPDTFVYSQAEAMRFSKPECNGVTDEDIHTDAEPFELIAQKMTNLLDDGAIKKRVLREGYGDPIPDKAYVTVHYNAYIEYNDDPFDSTYIRKKPFSFTVNNSETISGLDIGTQSMKLGELSQFMVKASHAYGPLGCLQRVPPNATILYEVEVVNWLDTTVGIPPPGNEEPQSYVQINRHAHVLLMKANDLFAKGSTRQAIRNYNDAVTKLLSCTLRDMADQEKQEALLLRIYTNLVVSYTKIKEPRPACTNAQRIYNLCKGTSLKVPPKVYFNHGRSLIQLSDYKWAEIRLNQARKLEPNNVEISKELIKLDEKRIESRQREVEMAKAMFRQTRNANVDPDFKKSMTRYCEDLKADSTSFLYNLPEDLSEKEIVFCKAEAQVHGLEFCSKQYDGETVYYIQKPRDSN